jgi:hypothetical protein
MEKNDHRPGRSRLQGANVFYPKAAVRRLYEFDLGG